MLVMTSSITTHFSYAANPHRSTICMRERTLTDLRQLRFAAVANTDETLALSDSNFSIRAAAPSICYCLGQSF